MAPQATALKHAAPSLEDLELEAEAEWRSRACSERDRVLQGRGTLGVLVRCSDENGRDVLLVDALNSTFHKLGLEFRSSTSSTSPVVNSCQCFLCTLVCFLNCLLKSRFLKKAGNHFQELFDLIAGQDTLLQTVKAVVRQSPTCRHVDLESSLHSQLRKVIDCLRKLVHVMVIEQSRWLQGSLTSTLSHMAIFLNHKLHCTTCPEVIQHDTVTSPGCEVSEAMENMQEMSCHEVMAVRALSHVLKTLSGEVEQLPDRRVNGSPMQRILRWWIMKTSSITMTRLLIELRSRFSPDDFQEKYRAIRSKAGAGDEMQVVAVALTVQKLVLPKFGFSGDLAGIREMRTEVTAYHTKFKDKVILKLMKDIHQLLDHGVKLPKMPITTIIHAPRFQLSDKASWMKHLADEGFVVLSNVADEDEVERAYDMLWQWIELSDSSQSIKRNAVRTWQDSDTLHCGWPAAQDNGIILSRGIGQSEASWYLRSLPLLKQAFAAIWGTYDLVCSFDGAGVFRPYGHQSSWKTTNRNWWHVDQAHGKQGLHCVQGLVTLKDATEKTGGLVVVPGSHRFHDSILRSHEEGNGWHFIRIEANEPWLTEGSSRPRLVAAKAGDLILWDSRTIHCNTPPLIEDPDLLGGNDLIRAVAYICMTPAAWCSKQVISDRSRAFHQGITTTHWPHEYQPKDKGHAPRHQLTHAQQQQLSPNTLPEQCDLPTPGRISMLPEARYQVRRTVPVYGVATTEWGEEIGLLSRGTEVWGYAFGLWLRLSRWPKVKFPDLATHSEVWVQIADMELKPDE